MLQEWNIVGVQEHVLSAYIVILLLWNPDISCPINQVPQFTGSQFYQYPPKKALFVNQWKLHPDLQGVIPFPQDVR